jgi:hypothetical protein
MLPNALADGAEATDADVDDGDSAHGKERPKAAFAPFVN